MFRFLTRSSTVSFSNPEFCTNEISLLLQFGQQVCFAYRNNWFESSLLFADGNKPWFTPSFHPKLEKFHVVSLLQMLGKNGEEWKALVTYRISIFLFLASLFLLFVQVWLSLYLCSRNFESSVRPTVFSQSSERNLSWKGRLLQLPTLETCSSGAGLQHPPFLISIDI